MEEILKPGILDISWTVATLPAGMVTTFTVFPTRPKTTFRVFRLIIGNPPSKLGTRFRQEPFSAILERLKGCHTQEPSCRSKITPASSTLRIGAQPAYEV